MLESLKENRGLRIVFGILFAGYGVYCMFTRTAFLPGRHYNDYLYLEMTGWPAVVFGGSLLVLSISGYVSRRLKADGNAPAIPIIVRGIGIALAAIGIIYAMNTGIEVA